MLLDSLTRCDQRIVDEGSSRTPKPGDRELSSWAARSQWVPNAVCVFGCRSHSVAVLCHHTLLFPAWTSFSPCLASHSASVTCILPSRAQVCLVLDQKLSLVLLVCSLQFPPCASFLVVQHVVSTVLHDGHRPSGPMLLMAEASLVIVMCLRW